MTTVLITGVTGFIGGHLADHLLAHGGFRVVGLSRRAGWAAAWEHLAGRVTLRPCDLCDPQDVAAVLREERPDWIAHLAGYSDTGGSFREPAACWAGNLGSTQTLYEAVANSGQTPRILFTSTGLVYGDTPAPADELAPLLPASPYAASKAAADLVSYQVTRSPAPGLDVVRVRLYNQIGPRQGANFAVARFARQLAAIEAGRQAPVISTGGLSAVRDFTDVRDMCRAFRLLFERGERGSVFNAASGTSVTMRQVLDQLRELSTVRRVEVHEEPMAARAGDTHEMRADVRALHAAVGWRPEIDLRKSLADVLDFWRGQP